MSENENTINSKINLIRTELEKANNYSKMLITAEFNEMSEDFHIKIVFARLDLLCADIINKKELFNTLEILKKTNFADFQIYTDECNKLEMKNCVSLNVYYE